MINHRPSETPPISHADFIRANTTLRPVSFVPELLLHLADEALGLWEMTEADLGRINLPPPFWAFAWAGGQALARYVLDHPELVVGQRVLDFASGSGLCALAAAKVGAEEVHAADIDAYAASAITLNATANSVCIHTIFDDLIGQTGPWSTILAGDISYQEDVATRVHAWLADEARRGVCVLIGDPGRAYLPWTKLRVVAEYDVPVTPDLEDATIKHAYVFTVASQG